MKWYWWLLIGLVIGVGGFFLIPLLLKSDKTESLEKARAAKAAKAKEPESESPADLTL
jgi:hypothetical protein